MHQKLKFDDPFLIEFTIQEIAFRLCTKQSAGGKNQKDKQLKFAPRLNKFEKALINYSFEWSKPQLILLNRSSFQMFILGHWK